MESVANRSQKAFSGYKKNEILSLSPVQVILKLYDYIIVSSKKKDFTKVNAGLAELIAALNFEYKELAVGFFRLYRYCQNQAQKGNFEEVEKVISQLRSTWAKAFKLS